MKLNKNIYYLFTLITILGLASCSSDDDSSNGLDNLPPVISINEPTQDEAVAVGGEVHLDVDLEDDVELASYKIDVHNDFDGHTHTSRPSSIQQTLPWALSQTEELEAGQTAHHIHKHLEVPANAAEGAYHVGIIALDQAGNQSEAYVKIIVGEDHSGEDHGITITSIETEDAPKGGELHLEAAITAEHGIQTVSVNIHDHGLQPSGDEENWAFNVDFTDYSGASASFYEHIDVPANATPGEYHMTITVIDAEGHTHAESAHIHVTETGNDATAIQFSGLDIPATIAAGTEMHAEATITADHGVHLVHVHIHSEAGNGWSFEEDYTNYDGQTTANFHEHIDIPASAAAGEYHFELEVKDEEGNTNSTSTHFDIN
ncbi:DUF4625 domain-containing protein [Mesonia aestuariivivens]|uniref:DUF4625 domain-containing protein n=1 Tax=Mesonia aestuariivivens TaxID=2796128 RepID=A0ABS6W179_9FLAO|nr:DUF4625 domain-containing protein [Mesonia aestuariivivens]MBW2961611.1 DUF4625 domain-containing protein [Mesonia aestuariivivens]